MLEKHGADFALRNPQVGSSAAPVQLQAFNPRVGSSAAASGLQPPVLGRVGFTALGLSSSNLQTEM